MLVDAMALSGTTLPQFTPGGSLSGTFRIVTADGAGPISAVLDPTATGKFSTGVQLSVVEQIPGKNGWFVDANKQKQQRGLWERAVGIVKRAPAVNKDFTFKFSVPAGTTCTGTVAGMTGVCLVKIANAHKAGPFGGVVPVQIASAAAGAGVNGANGATKCGRAFVA